MPYQAPTRARQRAAVACEECRRRKLRCDGQQPSCGVCQESGSVCEFIQRSTRGPKKGYVKVLKDRLVHMETLLGSKNEAPQEVHRQQGITVDDSVPLVECSDIPMVEEASSWLPTANDLGTTMSNGVLPELASTYEWTMTPDLSKATNGELNLSENMQAELDQLYFDRVHPSIPILNQRRYLSLRNRNLESPSRKCLQHSIWMLASLMSTQFRAIIEPLYHQTKQMLESLSVSGSEKGNSSDLELLQAWVLLATYESMRAFHRQAWISAGWSFRFVQGLHYHELDRPGEAPDSEDWVKPEEKRRVFWMAYLLDHLFSMRNNWPITLNEHVICTRLPCTEAEFQSGKHTRGDFLSEAMTRPKDQTQSLFNECIILATIAGRGLLTGQQQRIFEAYGDFTRESEWQHQWLDKILDARLQALPGNYPPPTEAYDPLLMFAHVLAQATVVYFCKGMLSQRPKPTGELNGPSFGALEYEIRVLAAMNSMFQIASELTNLHFSKVHPLMHIPLFMTAEFLYENLSTHESFHSCLAKLTDILRKLRNVNNLEQSYLDLLPQSCVAKSAELLNHTTRRSSSTLPLL